MNRTNRIRSLSWLLTVVLYAVFFCTADTMAEEVRTCGENLVWRVDDEENLIISGTGEMDSYIEKTPGWNKNSIRKVVIEPGVTSIGALAFDGCRSLREAEIPDTVTSIGDYAFSGCSLLKRIVLPDGISAIGANPFSKCGSMEEVILAQDHPVFSFRDGMLLSKPDGRLISWLPAGSMPDCAVPAGTKIIGDEAFFSCGGLQSVTIPEGVTEIGSHAFWGCSGLRTLDLPESVISIGRSAFSQCEYLSSVTLREGLHSIGDLAFNCCRRLQEITLPDSLEFLGTRAFSVCQQLSRVNVSADHPLFGSENGILYSKPDQKTLYYAAENPAETCAIPMGIRIIGKGSFGNGGNLKEIILPESVREIEKEGFLGCWRAERIVFSQGLETIGSSAFDDMSRLKEIALPEGVKSIGDYAFGGCSGLESASIPASVTRIGKEIFIGADTLNLIVYAAEGSAAEQYCRDNDLKAVLPDQEIPGPAVALPEAFAEQFPGYKGLYEAEPPAENESVYLAQSPDDTLVLLCGTRREDRGWTIIESAPLPAESKVVLYDGIRLIDLGYVQFTVGRYYDDVWGIRYIGWKDYYIGPDWVGTIGPIRRCFGVHSWADLTSIDWITLEGTFDGLVKALDVSALATPARKDSESRTPIFAAPDSDSEQIAALSNGAPLFAVEQKGEWTHVSLGRGDGTLWKLDGWIRTEDLAFGRQADTSELADPGYYMSTGSSLSKEVPLAALSGSEQLAGFEFDGEDCCVIGEGIIKGEEYWLVYDCFKDLTGFILKSNLYEPNR